jgi:CBS domain containing-hemolysin-like protein
MNGPALGLLLAGFALLIAANLGAAAVGAALRVYSLSVLKEVCAARGRPGRAQEVAASDERVERAAEIALVLSFLGIAVLALFLVVGRQAGAGEARVLAVVLAAAAVAHLIASLLGRAFAERLLDAAWPLADALRWPFAPLIGLMRAVEAALTRRGRSGRPALVRPASVEVEIPTRPGEEPEADLEAELSDTTRQRLERVVALEDRTVEELMTPRLDVVALPATVGVAEAAHAFVRSGLSRIPLYGENRDDVVGILYAKDLLPALADPAITLSPRKLAREPLVVPESKSAAELLDELRQRRVQLAVVVDEFGALSGLVTLEDLLEEIVGPIHDEHDPTPDDGIRDLGRGRYEVDAALTLEELNERLGLRLPHPADGDYHTVGGLVLDTLGRVPEEGARFRVAGVEFTVLRVVDHAIRLLRLDVRPPIETPLAS